MVADLGEEVFLVVVFFVVLVEMLLETGGFAAGFLVADFAETLEALPDLEFFPEAVFVALFNETSVPPTVSS